MAAVIAVASAQQGSLEAYETAGPWFGSSAVVVGPAKYATVGGHEPLAETELMSKAVEPIAETARSHLETLVPTAGPNDLVTLAVERLSGEAKRLPTRSTSSTRSTACSVSCR